MNRYPYTIENGAGEVMTFLGVKKNPEGDCLEVENRIQPGAGPPMHVHHLQEEAISIINGKMGYQIAGEEAQYAFQGEFVTFAPGQAHRFWNAGDEELLIRGYLLPPLNFEYLLTANFESMRKGGGRPNLFEGIYLLARYKSEFSLVIPGFIQQYLFPIIISIGHALGKYEKYADAPEPATKPLVPPQD